METNDEQGSGAQGLTGIGRSKKQRLSRKARGLTCANCRAKKVRTIHRMVFHFDYSWLTLFTIGSV